MLLFFYAPSTLFMQYLILLILLIPLSLHADTSYEDELIERARQQKLADSDSWHTLGHYLRNRPFSAWKSTLDDSRFFLADKGKYDPRAELEASIRSFFQPEIADKLHPQCQFVARYHWLKEQLHFNPRRLPEVSCKEFDDWRGGLNAKSLSLIFPTSFLNNPASAFGHTLLRLDQEKGVPEKPLLSYAVNYSAKTSGEDPITYALLGVMGGYQGFFSVAPYYKLVTQYSDIESRDIWEYKIDFTQEEIDNLVRHLWELRGIAADYFYFDENCSYHLLALLDAARPSMQLLKQAPLWVVPIDTVRMLRSNGVAVREKTYRPSQIAKLRSRIAQTSPKARTLAKKIIEEKEITQKLGTDPNLNWGPSLISAEAVDLAYDYLSYRERFARGEMQKIDQKLLQLLTIRSQLKAPDTLTLQPPSASPDEGHETTRLSYSVGRRNGNWNHQLDLRPAYHALIDPPVGYTSGSQIEFLNMAISQEEGSSVRFEEFTFVDIMSLNNGDEFISPLSWSIDAVAKREILRNGNRSLVSQVDLGFGKAWKLFGDHSYLYFLIDTELELHGSYDNNFAFGNGATGGLILTYDSHAAIQTEAKARRLYFGEEQNIYELTVSPRITLTKDVSLRLNIGKDYRFGKTNSFGLLSLDLFL